MPNLEKLEISYKNKKNLYIFFCEQAKEQILYLLEAEEVVLATPLTSRVKEWDSIVLKCEKYNIYPEDVEEINDVSGVRIVALFQRDIEKICNVIENNFIVTRKEDTSHRLNEDQFGYGSIHFEVRPREEWLKVPTLRKLEDLSLEIQVRTASQHIWAAASHKLQYKQEKHVPPILRRSINRTAALLEMVDLEFERLLNERKEYMESLENSPISDDVQLNIEVLRELLESKLPMKNRKNDENYDELLENLFTLGINTKGVLEKLIDKHLEEVLKHDLSYVKQGLKQIEQGELLGTTEERIRNGVYFSFVGLVRNMLGQEYGDS